MLGTCKNGDTTPKEGSEPYFKPLKDLLMRNPLRAKIYRLMVRKPGLNRNQISEMLGVHVNSIKYHVERFEEAGIAETRKGTHRRETLCFTAENVHLWDEPSTRALLGRSPTRRLASFLSDNPWSSLREAAEGIRLTVPSARRHMRMLEDHDLVLRARVDRQVVYHPEPELESWLEEYCKTCRPGNGEAEPKENGKLRS